MADSSRPRMYQTSIPFVQMYINTVDILRSPSTGKPLTLVSFSHDIYAGTGGFWTLELFDPSYIAIEELLIATSTEFTEVTEDAYGQTGDGNKAQSLSNISSALFRYGYSGATHDEKAVSRGPKGEEFFFGTVHAFVPRYETNGTYLTIRGDSAGTRIRQVPKVYSSFPNMSVFEIFKKVCEQREWQLTSFDGETESLKELEGALNKGLPKELLSTNDGAVSTEAEHVQHKFREKEDALTFLNRLCGYVRASDPKYNNFTCRLEYRAGKTADGSPTVPQGYLFFGCETFDKEPVRQYIYMRDPTSDVISFQPNVQVWVAQKTGASGITFKIDDPQTGELMIHTWDEVNRELHYNKEQRGIVAFDFNTFGKLQTGFQENDVNRSEGSTSGSSQAAGAEAAEEDALHPEMTNAVADRMKADEQAMNYWISMQSFINRATLEIFGDPSKEIAPGRVIAVYVFVPVSDTKMRFHWTSTLWTITGVNHEIRGGEMRTHMELTRLGWDRGGVITKAAHSRFVKNLKAGQQKVIEE